MNRLARRFRSLPIRSRLAMLVAAAVAFAVAAVSVTCWFIVQGKLYGELNNDLQSSFHGMSADEFTQLTKSCLQEPSSNEFGGGRLRGYAQIISAEGKVCLLPGSMAQVKVTGQDKAVAKNPEVGSETFRNGSDSDGNAVRVMTTAVLIKEGPVTQGVVANYAFVVAVPLEGTQSTLNELALILLLVSGIGVIGAGAAGLAVARAGLRPVDKLTEAVEHVARTEDLSIRIPVEEDSEDEVARLSRSFNSMTSSLANSRELQQQLIADAGHELRTPSPPSVRTSSSSAGARRSAGRFPPPTGRRCSPRSRRR